MEQCDQNGIIFIGPTVNNIELFALKIEARQYAQSVGIPTAPGSPVLTNVEDAIETANRVGYPVLIKVLMRLCLSKAIFVTYRAQLGVVASG